MSLRFKQITGFYYLKQIALLFHYSFILFVFAINTLKSFATWHIIVRIQNEEGKGVIYLTLCKLDNSAAVALIFSVSWRNPFSISLIFLSNSNTSLSFLSTALLCAATFLDFSLSNLIPKKKHSLILNSIKSKFIKKKNIRFRFWNKDTWFYKLI